MIKSITIKDFLSFKGTTTIDLNNGVNILLGINGSGKTSFINALRLLYEGVYGMGFEKLFQVEWGGFPVISNANSPNPPNDMELSFTFDHEKLREIVPNSLFNSDVTYSIHINPLGETNYTLNEELWSTHDSDPDKRFRYISFRNGKGLLAVRLADGKVCLKKFLGTTSGQELVLRQINDPMRYLPLHIIRTAISQMAFYSTFDTSPDGKLRNPRPASSETRLSPNGENLISVLNNLSKNTITFEKIEKQLQNINRHFKQFKFQSYASLLYLSLLEKNMRHEIGMHFISDGTLKYIILLSILLNDQGGLLVGLDEPESNLHPDMIHSVANMIKEATRNRQLIVATHSPLLLNDFELEDLLIFEKDENNTTVVKKYSEEDFVHYGGELLPGQLWLNGEIGGKRW